MTEFYGPTLPGCDDKESTQINDVSTTTKNENIIGPILPPNLQSSTSNVTSNTLESSTYGPALPPHLQKDSTHDDSDDEDFYGPLPVGVSNTSAARQALEERALQIKLGHMTSDVEKNIVREEWMLELPGVGASRLGLGPRQFRKNERPDFSDRSSWTDTPEQKAKKATTKVETPTDLKKEAALVESFKRDEQQALLTERHNRKKKRDKSLLEIHQEQLNKKKKEDPEQSSGRRPFNRETDLNVNQFDDAQKKSIMKKAKHLNDRFSTGQSKFL